jgi:hypothetical protein
MLGILFNWFYADHGLVILYILLIIH